MADNPIDAANVLNSDLNKIHLWAKKWRVTFNPSKSECLLFSIKHNKPLHPPLSKNQQQINEVDMHLTFTCDGTWHAHLTEINLKLGIALIY